MDAGEKAEGRLCGSSSAASSGRAERFVESIGSSEKRWANSKEKKTHESLDSSFA